MSDSDEQFFEALAHNREADEQQFEVELAKATTAAAKPRVAPKMAPKKMSEATAESEGRLTMDVYQTPSEFVIESAIAGVAPEELDIHATNDSITIRGERHHEQEVLDDDYLHQECYWGRFSRSILLPDDVDPEQATVSFKNGILTIRLPKLSRVRSKKLKVKLD
ncbi:MAG: Hsp20/alpha crystallin family protein [bacterium]|nr:Hsp20/alpha crystallin family protein [bacterium]